MARLRSSKNTNPKSPQNSPPKKAPLKKAAKGKVVKGKIDTTPIDEIKVSDENDAEEEVVEEKVEETKKPKKATKSPVKKAAKKVSASPKEQSPKAEVKKVTKSAEIVVKAQLVTDEILSKAISEIVKFSARSKDSEKNQLFEDDADSLYLMITTKKFYSSKPDFKPKCIRVPNSIFNLEDLKVCLIVRDNIIDEDVLEKIESSDIKLSKIVTVKEIKGAYKQYEAKRKLLDEYDLFLCDDSTLNLLPQALGKIFYNSSKYPLPIKLSAKSSKTLSIETLKNQVNRAVSSVSFLPPMGVNISVKFADTEFDTEKAIANVKEIINYFDAEQIRQISIKTKNSPSIPVYFTKKLYSDDDVVSETSEKEAKAPEEGIRYSSFEKALLELAQPEDIAKILGKKMGKIIKKKSTKKSQKNKVSKN